MDAVGFDASALCCDSGCARSAGCSCSACILSSTCRLRRGLRCPSSLGQLCCSPCSGLVPRSFWIWDCWSKHPIPIACGSSPMLDCTDPIPCSACLLRALGHAFLVLVCRCLVLRGCSSQLRHAPGCRSATEGAGDGSGELSLALEITWEKLSGIIKGIVWAQTRER